MAMDPAVFRAIASGNAKLFENLIKDKNIDSLKVTSQKNYNSLLHIAVRFNQKEITEQVLRFDPELIDQTNRDKETALHIASEIGNLELVELLIDPNNNGKQRRRDYIRKKNARGDTALHVAVRNGNLEVAKLLMQTDPALLHDIYESPLFVAVDGGFSLIADFILDNFPDAAWEGPKNMNALHAAVIRSNPNPNYHQNISAGGVTTSIMPKLSVDSIIRHTCRFVYGDHFSTRSVSQRIPIELLQKLFDKRPKDVEGRDFIVQWTPLHFAAHLGHLTATRILLEKRGTSATSVATIKDKEGMNALHIAAKEGHVNVMEEILRQWPDVSYLVDHRGWTALHVAVAYEKSQVVKYILKTSMLESLINMVDEEGNTPLHLAAAGPCYCILKLLVDDDRVDKRVVNAKHAKAVNIIRANQHIGALGKYAIENKLEREGGESSLEFLLHEIKTGYGNPKEKLESMFLINNNNNNDNNNNKQNFINNKENSKTTADQLKSISKKHVLVGILIATVTFAAGFVVPGGYINNNNNNKITMKMFVIANSLAFYCSMTSLFFHLFINCVDQHNYHRLLRFSGVESTLTYSTCLAMVFAFLFGMQTVSMLPHFTFVFALAFLFIFIVQSL